MSFILIVTAADASIPSPVLLSPHPLSPPFPLLSPLLSRQLRCSSSPFSSSPPPPNFLSSLLLPFSLHPPSPSSSFPLVLKKSTVASNIGSFATCHISCRSEIISPLFLNSFPSWHQGGRERVFFPLPRYLSSSSIPSSLEERGCSPFPLLLSSLIPFLPGAGPIIFFPSFLFLDSVSEQLSIFKSKVGI